MINKSFSRLARFVSIPCLALSMASCSQPIVVKPLPEAERSVRDARVLEAVRRLGQDGDWLVIRGYHNSDNFISAVRNAPFSHVAVLDLEKDQVIESESAGVHTTTLAAFVTKSHRLMIVRPQWATQGHNKEALVRARQLVGKPYDFTGLVGINSKDRYYCSEVAMHAYRPFISPKAHIPLVIPPDQMHYWGTVMYDTGAPESDR
jgi:hypothetical protein